MAHRNVEAILADPSFWESDDSDVERESDDDSAFEINSDDSDSASSDGDETEVPIQNGVGLPVKSCEWTDDLTELPDVNFIFEHLIGVNRDLKGVEHFEAVHLFQLFFTDSVLGDIVVETNRYAEQCQQNRNVHKDWSNISLPELKTWLGLIIATGIIQKKGRVASYWSKHWLTQTPGFNQTMSSKRFLQILSCIHFVDNLSTTVDKSDKFWKIRTLLDCVVRRFQVVYNPRREIAVDETMLKFKGRLGIKQYIKNKPIKWGIKLFTLAESSSGYIMNIIPYAGKREDTGLSKTAQIVIDVCQPYLNRGHYLFMDNYYTSIELIEYLSKENTLSCGTVNSNRKGLPTDMKNSETKRLKKGESLKRICNNVLAVSWKDTRVVNLLTNIPGNLDDVMIKRRDKKQGGAEVMTSKPRAIITYNSHMGGVDLSDQRVASYRRHMKSLTWYMQVFFYLLRLSAVQAFIVHKKLHPDSKLSQHDFFLQLTDGLIGGRTFTKKRGRPSVALPPEIRFDRTLEHAPIKYESQSRCVVHSNRVETRYGCGVCEKRMCPYPCFHRYHYTVNYPYKDPNKENAAPARKHKKIKLLA